MGAGVKPFSGMVMVGMEAFAPLAETTQVESAGEGLPGEVTADGQQALKDKSIPIRKKTQTNETSDNRQKQIIIGATHS